MNAAEARNMVADLEADALGEEPLGGVLVGRADDHVAELARRDRTFADDARVPARWARSIRPGPLYGVGRRRLLGDPGATADGSRGTRRSGSSATRVSPVRLDRQVEAGSWAVDPVEVVGVLGADADLDQAALRRVDEPELLAAVGGGERVARRAG